MEYIQHIIYINLEERVDRKNLLLNEISKIHNNIERFNAIKYNGIDNGYIGGTGCSLSHIGALKHAIKNNYKNVLIMEDDSKLNDFQKTNKLLKKIIEKNKDYDVIVLGGVGKSKSNGKLSAKHTPLPLLEFLDKHS